MSRFIAPRVAMEPALVPGRRPQRPSVTTFAVRAATEYAVRGGSFTRPVKAVAGDRFHADYGPPGSVASQSN